MYIIELEHKVWLSSVEGDPGRTLDIDNATRFRDRIETNKALRDARKYRPFHGARVISIGDG